MDKNVLKYELGVETEEEARQQCLEVIENIQKVMDIKGIRYVETFLRLLDFNK